jgi:3-methyladenine DNA glycosylase/8-oxoguanine DNA glycosylase
MTRRELCNVDRKTIEFEGTLDLRRTLRPLLGRFSGDGWWLTARTPDGPGSLRVSRSRTHIIGDSWGPGGSWMLERLAAITGLNDDPGHFAPDDPLISGLHRRNPGLRFGATRLVFDALVVAVCGQKVTGREAGRAIRGLYQRFSEAAPGPNEMLRLPPDPLRMAAAPYHRYHEIHLEKRRADILRNLASHEEQINALSSESPDTAAALLSGFEGVGEWSVAGTLAVSHGDPDQVPVGDFHIKHLVVHHLTGRDRGTDEEMLELLEPFRPHRGRVIRLLHTLGHAPKFGPRSTARDITRL